MDLFENGQPIETQSCRIKKSKITDRYLGQGFYQKPNITFSQASEVVAGHIQSGKDIETSGSEDDIIQHKICKAQIHITEVDQSDSSDNNQIHLSMEDNIITL